VPYFRPGNGWVLELGCAVGVATAYFLAARLGLALLTEGVAVFWPASGVAVGILVTLGRRARRPIVIGVIAATIAANLMGDRSLWTSVFNGFCNAGEAVLTAWLLERWFGRAFAFDDVRHVLGFVAAAALGTAASAVGGAATMTLLHGTAPFWDVWRAWFLSDGLGAVVVAPLVIGLGQLWRERPSRDEWIEGLGVLALLSLIVHREPPSRILGLIQPGCSCAAVPPVADSPLSTGFWDSWGIRGVRSRLARDDLRHRPFW